MSSGETSFWQWIATSVASVAGALLGYHKYVDGKIAVKADKSEMEKGFEKALGHIEKLYENAEADRRLTRDLHDKAMEEVRNNQTTIIGILAGRRE